MGKTYEHLSAEERGVIFAMKLEDRRTSEIALVLQRSRSTISRGHADRSQHAVRDAGEDGR